MKCEYADALSPTFCCGDGRATHRVTVRYNAVESDTLDLCKACTRWLRRDARGHRYQLTTTKLRGAGATGTAGRSH